MSKESVLVTGGAGFVGSVLVRKLLEKDYDVTVFDNLFRNGSNLAELTSNPNFHFIKGDVTDYGQVSKLKDYDGVINLAAIVGEPWSSKLHALAWNVNVDGISHIAEKFGRKSKLIFASTGSVYGKVPSGLCKETDECEPLGVYGKSKLMAEEYMQDFRYGDKYVGLIYRFSTGAGVSPNMRFRLLPNTFTWNAHWEKSLVISQAEFRRSFISVQDMADSFIYGLENFDKMLYAYNKPVYNVGHPENNWTKRQLAEYVCSKTGASLFINDEMYKDPDQRDYEIDFTRLKSVGFECKDTMDKIIDDLLKVVPFYDSIPALD